MLPGVPKELKNADVGEKELGRVEAIIRSMTSEERRKPDLMNGSRRARIAAGSGTTVNDVNQLLNQFKQMQKMMKGFGGKAVARKGKKNKNKQSSNKQLASKVKPGRTTTAALPDLKQMKALQQQLEAGQGLDDLLSQGLPNQRKDQPWP